MWLHVIQLKAFSKCIYDQQLNGWNHFGCVVQMEKYEYVLSDIN